MRGPSANDVIKAQDSHLKEMVAGTDNEDIIRVGPGEPITLEMMVSKELCQS